ncbi:MAG TPA: putative peptidoglycan glycosyltransferase FtsW [Candidatus Binatia bacterium]|jgi:cell division protein FtsW|nr:putative peptidoglycan glycosyltransferase FtsW [Candidatus Binatia bacterium]
MASVTVVRKKSDRVRPGIKLYFDYWLLLAATGLIVIGMLMVYSTTFDLGLLVHNEPTYFFRRQLGALALGVIVSVVFVQFDYHVLRRFSVVLMVITLGSLLFLVFFGNENFGAARGLYANSYQPSELAKLATIFYISHWLSSKGERIKDITYGLLPFAFITGVVCFLIVVQPDLSTAGLIAIVSLTIFFVAGAELKQMFIAGTIGGGIFVFLMMTVPHAAARVAAWQEVLRDPNQAIWQVKQALIALGSGGFLGVGLGNSTQKFGPLPAAHTDGVFAIVGEELGLAGSLVVILLLGMLVWRGIRAAQNARDSYGALLALGITCWLSYQSLINIAVITAVIPFTGIPLPFLSYGGSSMLISVLGVGVLLNISRDAHLTTRSQPQKSVTESIRASFSLRRGNRRSHLSRFGGDR